MINTANNNLRNQFDNEPERRYNRIWGSSNVQKPELWSIWKTIKDFQEKKILEIGPGNYPKIPIKNGFFVDISDRAIENLKRLGGRAVVGNATSLPFKDRFFDLVVALEVLEHIKDDKKAFFEIARVLKPSGIFLFSVPLGQELYDEFDRITGHERRYEIEDLKHLLLENRFKILKYRHCNPYPKLFENIMKFLFLKKLLLSGKKHEVLFGLPRPFVSLYSRAHALIERQKTPQWQKDVENIQEYFNSLPKYKGKGIILFCQKS